jgi:hypothetical protein
MPTNIDELEHDIRNDEKQGFGVIELGSTSVGGGRLPWDGELSHATPFRDGAHAHWDAKQFGNLPIYVVAPDGRFVKAKQSDQPAI